MSDVLPFPTTDGDRFLLFYRARQRRIARLYCPSDHDMQSRASFHLGAWRVCSRCGLLELVDA